MLKVLAVLTALFAFFPSSTVVAADGGCRLKTAVLEEGEKLGLRSVEYTGDKAAKVLAAIEEKSGPPPESWHVTSIIAFDMQDGRIVLAFFQDECVLGIGQVPSGYFDGVLRKAFGQAVRRNMFTNHKQEKHYGVQTVR